MRTSPASRHPISSTPTYADVLPAAGWLLVALLLILGVPGVAKAGGTLPTARDNSGAASYEIPLEVPPGPAGSTPDLALVYSSAGGLGNAGFGWSLPYSSVHLDQRWGVPIWWLPDGGYDCDPEAWAGRLGLDSMESVPWAGDPLWSRGRRCIYRTRPDTFAAIAPVWRQGPAGPGPITDLDDQPIGWAVLKPDGTVWWYGDDPERGLGAPETTYRRIAPGGSGQSPIVVEWLLHCLSNPRQTRRSGRSSSP